VDEVTDEPLYRDRVCGIDIGKAGMAATIRVPSDRDRSRRAAETRSFGTTRREVLALADWLRAWQVPAVVMEATGDYWKPVFYRLEAEGLECVLADAKQVRNLPGRPKRDPSDSRWLAACFERGAVTSCFVATPEFRVIREHTRYRRDLTAERTRDKQRAEKLLESAALKLSAVLTDMHGVTGRDIMDHLIAGERDPKVLAALARGRARVKIPQLRQALEGAEFFTGELAALLQVMLARIDRIDGDIAALTAVIERLLAPHEEQLQQAESMPGWGRRAAQDVLAETGADMSRFPTGGHLASWAGRTPLDSQSGSRARRARHRHGNRYVAAVTGETAAAAGKTQTREGARHRRISRRRGKAKAIVATGNTQMRVYHKLLSSPGTRYEDLGWDYYERERNTARQVSHHIGKLAGLGYEVTLCKLPNPDPGPGGDAPLT
jgi:transposase